MTKPRQHLFLYNHGTKDDLHTFEVFQRTKIEEEDGGAVQICPY